MKLFLLLPVTTLLSSVCFASTECSDLASNSPNYKSAVKKLMDEAKISPSKNGKSVEQAAKNVCDGHSEKNDEMIDQGLLKAREVSGITKVLVLPSTNKVSTSMPAVRKPTSSESSSMDDPIDKLFIQWGRSWWTDKYIQSSAHIAELLPVNQKFIARGNFSFVRGGGSSTIPFSAVMKNNGGVFNVINLCYNDTTTGMADCTENGMSSASSRLMTQIIAVGILAGISGNSSSSENDIGAHEPIDWEYMAKTRENEEARLTHEPPPHPEIP